MDVSDENFAITAFIAELGVQSKDLMFSISKNPQETMIEVLAKAEKYINGEEALISKRESSSAHKEKAEATKEGAKPLSFQSLTAQKGTIAQEPQQLSLREPKQLGRQNNPKGTTSQELSNSIFRA